MLQDDRSLTATSPSPTSVDFEETLSFDPESGIFTFGSVTQPITGAFQIPLGAPQTILINAGPGIQFVLPTSTSTSVPIGFLPFNDSGTVEIVNVSATQIELDVTALPSTSGVLGFLLFVQLISDSPTVQRIETPPFFITPNQPFTGPEFKLNYDSATGDFNISKKGGSGIPPIIAVERAVILLRLSEGSSNDSEVQTITVVLHEDAVSAGIIFAQTAAIVTLLSGPIVTRNSNTEVTITQAFTPGAGFGVSFGVEFLLAPNEPCTVYSPDPIIVDKTVGTNPGS